MRRNNLIGYQAGASFWWDWPPELRRREGIRKGWSAEKAQRWADNPFLPELQDPWHGVDLDEVFTRDDFWAWIADLDAGIDRRPFLLPGTTLPTLEEHARDVELTQRAFGRRPRPGA